MYIPSLEGIVSDELIEVSIVPASETSIVKIPAFEGITIDGLFQVKIPLLGLIAPRTFKCVEPIGWDHAFELREIMNVPDCLWCFRRQFEENDEDNYIGPTENGHHRVQLWGIGTQVLKPCGGSSSYWRKPSYWKEGSAPRLLLEEQLKHGN